MTQADGTNKTKDEYIAGWTSMMITIWQEKIKQFNIIDTGALLNSFSSHIARSGTDVAAIYHEFNLYGVYVERGHAKSRHSGNFSGDVMMWQNKEAFNNPDFGGSEGRPWLHRPFKRSFFSIQRFMADNYGVAGTRAIMSAFKSMDKLRSL
jgi:hypothetical protein